MESAFSGAGGGAGASHQQQQQQQQQEGATSAGTAAAAAAAAKPAKKRTYKQRKSAQAKRDAAAAAFEAQTGVNGDGSAYQTNKTRFFPEGSEKNAKERQLRSLMTDDQEARYLSFRRSKLNLESIKTHVRDVIPGATHVDDKIAIVLEGSTKMFVGEIIERARDLMERCGDTGAIPPRYIEEAYRQIVQEGRIPYIPAPRRKLR